MFALYLAQIVNSGLALGAVYGIMALGFSLIFSASRLINFAQGELLLLGGLIITSLSGVMNLPPLLALLAASLAGYLLGRALFATTLGLTLRAAPLRQLMLTVAASLVFQGVAILAWGKNPLMPPRLIPMPDLRLGPLFLGRDTATALVLAVVCMVVLGLFLNRTRLGRGLRATAQNAVGARLQGVDTVFCHALSFALAGALASLAALAVGPQTGLRYDMGLGLGLKGFAAATIGGYTSLGKVFAGGIVLGLAEAALVLTLSGEVKETAIYALIIILLVAAPRQHDERP
ncbi:High-affinity branched-chain amino acid transport system permease protein LivH [Desulfovibrio sp. DV]|uniref:branched-chain amino acid ABC transporter permease n=1 Tax=Desulfovibrio sp. DV TaxID=1844708 RepID=UPI00094B9877|nr:branched-chain amino acid ABC transporter permease [Desulfovibrio sp. DV]OLN24989.1 High-affinity branched-chain amino acid transport system permease protein LivH [Desulfovibrio sp. DV]